MNSPVLPSDSLDAFVLGGGPATPSLQGTLSALKPKTLEHLLRLRSESLEMRWRFDPKMRDLLHQLENLAIANEDEQDSQRIGVWTRPSPLPVAPSPFTDLGHVLTDFLRRIRSVRVNSALFDPSFAIQAAGLIHVPDDLLESLLLTEDTKDGQPIIRIRLMGQEAKELLGLKHARVVVLLGQMAPDGSIVFPTPTPDNPKGWAILRPVTGLSEFTGYIAVPTPKNPENQIFFLDMKIE